MSTSMIPRLACVELTLIVLVMVGAPHGGSVIYVDDDAPAGGNGTSWDMAYRFLQDALTDAADGGVSELRVGQGTYKPDRDETNPDGTGDREATFELLNGVALMGGYAGIGAKDPDARDIELYVTTCSGDLLGNDGPNFENNGENSFHVVVATGVNQKEALLDGFSIVRGNADGPNDFDSRGGGIFALDSSTAVIGNCTFSANSADLGGGIYGGNSDFSVLGCIFISNEATDGGGVYVEGAMPSIINCTFDGNEATHGGGMFVGNTSPSIVNCAFLSNAADQGGGVAKSFGGNPQFTNCEFSQNFAMMTGGGLYVGAAGVTLTDCIIDGNIALDDGGGMWNGSQASTTATNSVFSGNLAGANGGGLYNEFADIDLSTCTFNDNAADNGGGMYSISAAPVLTACIFSENGGDFGGGMYNENGEASFEDCSFIGNEAIDGAGLYTTGESLVLITSCTFGNNQAVEDENGDGGRGGGVFNASNLDLTGSTFDLNSAERHGGGLFNFASAPTLQGCSFTGNSAILGGGIANENGSNSVLTECTFTGNIAEFGGGVSNFNGSDGLITDCLFSDNEVVGAVPSSGGGIHCHASSPMIVDCLFVANTAFREGGGISLKAGSNATVTRCTFEGNFAHRDGGGLWAFESNPTITGCTFAQNVCGGVIDLGRGGGMFSENGIPIVNDNLFIENMVEDVGDFSSFGGGIYIADTGDAPLITRCSFIRNSSSRWGGGVAISNSSLAVLEACTFNGNTSVLGGGALVHLSSTAPTLVNCVLVGNMSAGNGGAINGFHGANLTLINCTVSRNVSNVGGGFWSSGSIVFFFNSIIWGNFASVGDPNIAGNSTFIVEYSNVEGGFAGAANIDVDPLYILDPDPGADEQWGTKDDNYGNVRLGPGSLCVDAASNDAVPKGITTDLDGNPRFVDDPMSDDCWQEPGTCGDPPIVDMGAYEFQPVICPWDLDGNGSVGASDLLSLLAQWGTDPGGPPDFDGSGSVGASDLLALLANWGPCP